MDGKSARLRVGGKREVYWKFDSVNGRSGGGGVVISAVWICRCDMFEVDLF